MPPTQVKENVRDLVKLLPDDAEDLLSALDQPLEIATCTLSGKEFLLVQISVFIC